MRGIRRCTEQFSGRRVMKLAHVIGFSLALLGCAGESPLPSAQPVSFELRLEGAGGSMQDPPILTTADVASVKAVTKSAWYVLSGRHETSKVVLTVKPASLVQWLSSIRAAASRGDHVLICIDQKSIGTMVLMQTPTDANFEISGSFISSGTEDQRSEAVKKLAAQIKQSLK
jgi:hypothetical protein